MTIALSQRTRQRLAGWTCVLSYAWAAVAPIAHAARVLPLEGKGRYSQYDALNRPETITQGEQMTRYGYDLAGRAVMLIGGNGQVTENTYDVAGRLTNRVLFRSLTERADGDVMAEFGWAHDAVGNVVAQHEVWPGSADRAAGVRATTMTYDGANRLETETITDPEQGVIATTYAYDDANNRDTKTVTGGSEPGFWDYTYNGANQLKAWEKRSAPAGTVMKAATLTYDLNGNRTSQTITEGAETKLTGYAWDAQDRLSAVTVAAGVSTPTTSYHYDYDYRTRRTGTHETTATTAKHTTIVFAGGLSLAEWETSGSPPSALSSPPTVEYTRGPDMGGGVGGLLYSARGGEAGPSAAVLKYNLSNGRGDVVAQSDSTGALTWTASYEAYGKRTKETGTNADKQRANTKDEDPTGLLNEGYRYRDIETGVWLSRDPAGFVDGPNLYAYVKQNPWTGWDPDGLKVEVNRTPKSPVKQQPKMTSAQKSAAAKAAMAGHRSGDNTHTEITYDAVVLDRTTKGLTDGNMAMIRANLEKNINEVFTGEDAEHNQSWKMNCTIKIVSSAKEISDTDHVIAITDTLLSNPKFGDPKTFGGLALAPKTDRTGFAVGFGGKTMVLNGSNVLFKSGDPRHVLSRTGPHEVGHSLGLQHPDTPGNPIKARIMEKDQLMIHEYTPDARCVNRFQIDMIHQLYQSNELNKGQVDLDKVSGIKFNN